jgi:hypothetical protein
MNSARRFAHRLSRLVRKSPSKRDFLRRGLLAERLESRALLAGDVFISDYWNGRRPEDVNADSHISPIDALVIINELNSVGSHSLVSTPTQDPGAEGESGAASGRMFYDVNNDGYISPLDGLMVINALNGEGEPPLMQYNVYVVNVGQQASDIATPPTSLTTISKGQDYELVVTVKDLRSGSPLGVAQGHVDVLYDPSLTSVYVHELQDIVITGNPVSASFRLSFGGQNTSAIAYDASDPGPTAGAIDSALEALSTVGANNVEVTEEGGIFRVRFMNNLGDKDVGDISIFSSSFTGGTSPSISVSKFADGLRSDANAFEDAFRSRNGYPNANNPAYYNDQPFFFAGNAADRVNDLGGTYFTFGPDWPRSNVFERELARSRMNADEAGFVFFTLSVANMSAGHDTALYTNVSGDKTEVLAGEIAFSPDVGFGPGVIRLEIQELVSANPDIVNVAEGSGATTFNPIAGVPGGSPANGQDVKNAGANAAPLRITAVNGQTSGTINLPSGGTVTFSGSTTTPSITYTPATDFNGPDVFSYTISDTVNFDTTTVTVNVSPVNDAPVNRINGVAITAGTAARNATEGTPFVFNAANSSVVSVLDIDAGAATNNEFELTVTNGTLTLSTTTGLTPISGANGTSNMKFSGSLASINAALNGMTYNPAGDFNGTSTLTISYNDKGNTGSGGSLTDTDTLNINVAAVNDAPINSVPGPQQVDENVPPTTDVLTFSTANLNAISVGDIDAGSATIDVDLSVTKGALTAVPTAGVLIDTNGTNHIVLHGSQANINTALNGLQYVPNSGVSNEFDTLTITTDDNGATGSGGTLSDTDQVSIEVIAVLRPRAKADNVPRTEGNGPVDIDVMDNDLAHIGVFETTLLSFTQPAAGRGTVTRNDHGTPGNLADDTLIYTPPADPNFFGTVTFQYTINDTYDPSQDSPLGQPDADSTATVTVTIAGVNDQPVANPDSGFTTAEDTTLTTSIGQSVLNNDTDPDNQFDTDGDGNVNVTNTLTAQLVAGSLSPAGGSLTLNPNGTFSYTPPTNYNGPVTFQYQVNDGQGQGNSLSAPATVSITVTPVNDKPVGSPDTYSVAEDGTLTADGVGANPAGVLANDNDGDPEAPADPLTAVLVAGSLSNPGQAFTFNSDGTFSYVPTANFSGTVTFQYRADDGAASNNLSDPVTVTITVTPVNDAPVAVNDSYTVTEDALLNANNSAPNRRSVTFNDTDVDSATISVSLPLVDLPDNGVLNMNANGTFTYQPNQDFVGTDTFQYRAFDGSATSANIATVTITVTDANDAPVALPDSGAAYNINEDNTLNVAAPGVLGNDTDPDVGQTATLTAQLVPGSLSPAGAGTLNLSANGAVQFIPSAHFFGTVTFQYRANDNQGLPNSLSNVATVTIQVAEVNDAPNAVNDSFTAIKDFEDQVINVLANDSLAPDTNPNESLSVIGVSTTAGGPFTTSATTAQGGTVSIVGGQVLYDSPPGFESPPLDTFFYRVSDNRPGGALTDDAQVTVEVLAFVPKFVEGFVYIDGDNNGQIFAGESFTDSNANGVYDAGEAFADTVGGPRDNNKYDAPEKRVQGVKIQLAGTDFLGTPVSFTTTTDASGHYRFIGNAATQFQGIQPGSYTVTELQPSYLTDGQETESSALASISANDQFQISWGPQDFSGHVTGLNFAELGISTSSLTDSSGLLQELLASSSANGLVITANLSGAYVWSWAMPGWDNMLSCQLQLSADLAHATLTVTDGQGSYSIQIHQDPNLNNGINSPPAGSMARFRVLGHSASGDYLIRLDGTAEQFFGFGLAAAAPVVGEGEGEAVDPAYAQAVDAAFGDGEAWA